MIHKDEENLMEKNVNSANIVRNLFKTDGLLNSMNVPRSDAFFSQDPYYQQPQQPPPPPQPLLPLTLGGCCSCKYIVILIIFIVIFTSVMSFANK
jgi:hypothetical protein